MSPCNDIKYAILFNSTPLSTILSFLLISTVCESLPWLTYRCISSGGNLPSITRSRVEVIASRGIDSR